MSGTWPTEEDTAKAEAALGRHLEAMEAFNRDCARVEFDRQVAKAIAAGEWFGVDEAPRG